jgi:hypothetical protein
MCYEPTEVKAQELSEEKKAEIRAAVDSADVVLELLGKSYADSLVIKGVDKLESKGLSIASISGRREVVANSVADLMEVLEGTPFLFVPKGTSAILAQ